MKPSLIFLPILCLCSVLLCITASAQSSDAYLFVVHGAAGRNIAPTTNPAIPVDVLANDQLCLVKGVAFGDVAGQLQCQRAATISK